MKFTINTDVTSTERSTETTCASKKTVYFTRRQSLCGVIKGIFHPKMKMNEQLQFCLYLLTVMFSNLIKNMNKL